MRRSFVLALAVLTGCAHHPPPPETASLPPPPKGLCVVLSVGGPKGLAHLGALDALRAEGLQPTCVVGNSMGSLIGALYASAPTEDTTARFNALLGRYVKVSEDEAAGRAGAGVLLGALLAGPVGAVLGGMGGASSVEKLSHPRFVHVLDQFLNAQSIETLAVPFETSFAEVHGESVGYVTASAGNVAAAVGSSVANPYIFPDIDVRKAPAIDPGLDRLAAVPVEQACRSHPGSFVLAMNVTDNAAMVPAGLACEWAEVRIPVEQFDAGHVFVNPERVAEVVQVGRTAVASWLANTPDSQRRIALAAATASGARTQ